MPLTQGLQLGFGLQTTNPLPADSWAGPYVDVAQANASVPPAVRFEGREVIIWDGIRAKIYGWYNGILDGDLEESGSGGSSQVQIQNDGVDLTLRDKINLYSGISAVDDAANNRTNFSFGGTLAKDTDLDTGTYNFNIIKGTTALKMKTEQYFNLGGAGADGSGTAYGLAQFASGELIAGGDFSEWNGTPVGYIVKLSNGGTQDTTFATNIGTGFDNNVTVVKITSTNKIIVGGYFGDFNGSEANGIYALNADGTPYTTFNTNIGTSTGSGSGNYIASIAIDETNSLIFLAGWWPAGWNGNATYKHFIALNFDGTVNTAFMTNMGTGFDNETTYVFVQANSKVVVGGYFSSLNSVSRNSLARLNADGTPDSTFNTNIGTGPNGNLKAMGEQSDGGLIMSTHGSSFNGTSLTKGNLYKLSSTGVFDAAFYANIETMSTLNQIYGVAVDSDDDSIIFSGYFLTYGAHNGFVVRLNADGTYNTTYGDGILTDGSYSEYGNPLIIDYNDNKKVYIGTYGNYDPAQNNYPGVIRFLYAGDINTSDSLSTVNSTTYAGSIPLAYESDVSMNYTPRSLVDKAWVESQASTASNGLTKTAFDITLGGELTQDTEVAGKQYNTILRNYAPGVSLKPRGTGRGFINGGPQGGAANRSIVLGDGKILIAGGFTSFDGDTSKAYIVKVNADGQIDQTFNVAGITMDGSINDIAVQSDDKIIIVGSFTTVNGNTVGRIARLNADGSYDGTFSTGGTGFNKSVFGVAVNGSDEIYCVGDFETFNGGASAGLRKLDANGATVAGFNVGLGLRFGGGGNSWGRQVEVLTGGKILVCGPFNYYDATPSFGIVRINEADGTRDGTFSSPLGDGENCFRFDINPAGTKIIMARGASARIIMTDYDGAVDGTFAPGTGFVWSIVPSATQVTNVRWTPDGNFILVAGQFDTYNGVLINNNYSGHFVKLTPTGVRDVDSDFGFGFTQSPAQNRGRAFEWQADGKLIYTVGFNSFYRHDDFKTELTGVIRMWDDGTLDMGTIEVRNTPLFYKDDYTSAFDDLALVHKKYVDDAISAAGGTVYGTDGQLPYTNATGDGFDYTADLVYKAATKQFVGGNASTAPVGSITFTFGDTNINRGVFGSAMFGELSEIDINVGSAFNAGENNYIGAYGGHTMGRTTRVTGAYSWAGGWYSPGTGTNAKTFAKAVIVSGQASFGYYTTDGAQVDNDGVLASASAVLGGLNPHIPADSPRTVILGGSGIKARAAAPDQVYVPNLNINSIPANDDALTQVLVRDNTTGQIKYRTATSLSGWPLSGTASITGDVTMNATNHAFNINTVNSSRLTSIVQTGSVGSLSMNASYSPLSRTSSIGLSATGGISITNGNVTNQLSITLGSGSDDLVINSALADFSQSQRINFSTFKIEDFRTIAKGIEYGADYSANYTARSLVDKAYVDSVAGGGGFNFTNGITEDTGDVKLGGALIEATTITTTTANSLTITGKGATIDASDIGTAQLTVAENGVTMSFNDTASRTIEISDTNFRMFRSASGSSGNVSLDSTGVYLYNTDGSNNAEILLDLTTSAYMRFVGPSSESKIEITSTTMTLTGTDGGFEGAKYAADYSANYTNRSLVDKEYVDSVAGGGGSYTFQDGIVESAGTVSLGGSLTQNITIDMSGNRFWVTDNANTSGLLMWESGVTNIFYDDMGNITQLDVRNESISLAVKNMMFNVSYIDSKIIATTPSGSIEYFSDYSANYTARSLVDKGYVDSVAVSYTFQDGLTESGGVVSFGGTLTAGGHDLALGGFDWAVTQASPFVGDGVTSLSFDQFNGISLTSLVTTDSDNNYTELRLRLTEPYFATTSGGGILIHRLNSNGNTTEDVLTIRRSRPNFAGANNIGARVKFQVESATNDSFLEGYFDYVLTTATLATGNGQFRFSPVTGGTVTQVLAISGTGAVYSADYSGANSSNPRWIPDKAYVDSVASGGAFWALTGTSTLTGDTDIDIGAHVFNFLFNSGNDSMTLYSGGFDMSTGAINMVTSGTATFGSDTTFGISVGTIMSIDAYEMGFTLNPGATDADATLSLIAIKTSTNTIAPVAKFLRRAQGGSANNVGAELQLGVENTTNTARYLSIQHQLTDAANTTEDSIILLRAYNNGTLTDFLRIDGGQSTILTTLYGVAQYSADFSANYTTRSLIDKGYADGAYWKTTGSSLITGAATIQGDGSLINIYSPSAGNYGAVQMNSTFSSLSYTSGGLTSGIRVGTTYGGIEIYDAITTRGMHYLQDFSANGVANHGDRWIPDVGYVKLLVNPTPVTQNISGAVSIDLSTGTTFYLTLTANVTSFTFTNEVVGKQYTFYLLQSTTAKTLIFATGKFRFSYGTAPVLTDPTTNSPTTAIDVVSAICQVSGRLDVVMTPNMIAN